MTAHRERVIYRSDPDFDAWEQFMRFRLHYEGPLLASSGEPHGNQADKRAPHKHSLRREFHQQLKHFWSEHPFLSTIRGGREIFGLERGPEYSGDYDSWPLLVGELADIHVVNGQRFVPLVCKQFHLLCGVELLLLRRDRPGGIFSARDLDNRLKTVFDALKMPANLSEMAGCEFGPDEDPMFVLLQDDSLITQVTVETDDLLDPPFKAGRDDSFVRLLLTVDIRPYHVNMFNISFG